MWCRAEQFLRSPETAAQPIAFSFCIKTGLTILATNNWHIRTRYFTSVGQLGYKVSVALVKASSVLKRTDCVITRQRYFPFTVKLSST